uniref:Tensin 3 n=1 Tax=Astatotilapia calliptera TaxID=8154 RepID=A0AAX7U4R1_ASTCA
IQRFIMEEGYELDLTYITERIIAVSFPRGCSEEIYSHNLKDVTRMLKSKHADNYLIINLSEKRQDLSRMNPKTLDTGWPDLHAPPLDKICTICKAMESWLNADPLHVAVIHCRVTFYASLSFCQSADQALDRFAMRKYYDDKVSALMTPSQKRYVWILNSLLSGSMKINASPLFMHCVILHGIPDFNSARVCCPYIKVYQGMQAVYSSGFYHIGPGHRDRVCIMLEPAQLLKGDIMIKCYHKSEVTSEREVIFRVQFHTGAVQGYNLMFEKEDMETANKDPRFPDYGKVELVFSEGPEKIPGADKWKNGGDVIVDYNTADPLTRWDSYQNICDGEGLTQDRTANKRSPTRGNVALAQGPRTTSATSSPDHSDHALSVSSDSGLSSTSLWADKPTPVASATTTTTTTSVKANQGPSQQEKVQLKRLLSGFGLEDPSLEEMTDEGARVGVQQVVPAQVHINGDPQPRERETDILDDEVITGHDLHSVDSLGTLSSSCHKSSQNSLLSDGFGSPGGEEQQSQSQHHIHHIAPHPIEDYERSYAEARRGCLSYRSNSIASSNPSNAPVPQQHVYRQGSYSTQSWVRQQQMVAAQHFTYMPEDGNDADRFHRNKQGGSLPKAGLPTEPQGLTRDSAADLIRNAAPHKEQTSINNNNNNKRDEEFKSLTKDIDNSIDQLNQLIMDLDPTFVPSHGSSIKRKGGTPVNGSVGKCSNGINLRFSDNNSADLKSTQQTGKIVSLGVVHSILCRSDSADYRSNGPDVDNSDIPPPTPAFPISPPTPYGEYTAVQFSYISPRSNQRSHMANYTLNHSPAQSFEEQDDSCLGYAADCPNLDRDLLPSMDGQNQLAQMQPPLLPEKKRTSDGEHSLRTASPALSGFSSPHSGSSLSIPFPNILPDLSAQTPGTASPLPDVLANKQVTVKFVQDTSKFWYKPDISRDQAISVLKDKEPGCFIVRDSHSFRGAYGLAMKVATPPPSVLQQNKKGGDLANELVRHFLIECTQKGVRLKGCPNEPYFGKTFTWLANISDTIWIFGYTTEIVLYHHHVILNLSAAAACNVWFLGSVEMESLTGVQAVQKATTMVLNSNATPTSTVVHFKVSSQGITLTDNQRKLFFRRHYNVNTVIYCALDPQDRKWKKDGCPSARIFGFVARKTGTSTGNVCHLFAEHDPEQPASAIVNFVSKVMIGSHKSK